MIKKTKEKTPQKRGKKKTETNEQDPGKILTAEGWKRRKVNTRQNLPEK